MATVQNSSRIWFKIISDAIARSFSDKAFNKCSRSVGRCKTMLHAWYRYIKIVGMLLSIDQVLINKWTANVFWGHSFQAYDMDISVVCARLVFICCMILEIQLLLTIFNFIGTQSELPCIRLNLSVHWGQHNKIHCFTGNFFLAQTMRACPI